MPRIDDYKQALELGRRGLTGKNPDLVARLSGAQIVRDKDGNTALSLAFLNEDIWISWPEIGISSSDPNRELFIQQQILILHYLHGAWAENGPGLTGEWCAFQDIPDGRFYLDAFRKRAKTPLLRAFGAEPERLIEVAKAVYDAEPFDHGDVSVLVKAFPLVRVALIIWKGDEEFPPESNILFDRNISRLLSAEDIAWLAGMIVYPLMGR
ncbi:MAG: DUF3786 domain-containing protein [Deltaproteobacteria bacterium]|nr:DUF3786 domain-containing protein [Deltaproteobacteria bacterium]